MAYAGDGVEGEGDSCIWDAREKEYRENWYAREKRWAASLGEESLEEWLDSVMALAKAAFAMFVFLCLDVLAMFASVCTLVRNLGASE